MAKASAERRSYHHGDLRRALIAAAESLLAERGTEGFTLRECARRAGVSHAAPAHHFGDVRGLLTAVTAEGFDRLTEATRQARDETEGSAADRLCALMRAYVETAVAFPGTFRLMFASDRPDFSAQQLQQSGRAAYGILVDAIQSLAREQGRPPPEPYSPEVTLAWSVAHGFASLLVERRIEQGTALAYGGDWRARCEKTLRLFVAGLSDGARPVG